MTASAIRDELAIAEEWAERIVTDHSEPIYDVADSVPPAARDLRLEIVDRNRDPFQRFDRKLPTEVWIAAVYRDERKHGFLSTREDESVLRRRVLVSVPVATKNRAALKRPDKIVATANRQLAQLERPTLRERMFRRWSREAL